MPEPGTIGTVAAASSNPTTAAAPNESIPSNVAPGAIPSKTETVTPSAPELFEVKVDGKVERMTREQLLQAASLGKAGFQRMEQANKVRAQAEAFIEKFRKDPMGALEDPALGLTDQQRRDAIEKYYQKKYIERDKMSPEQLELEKARQELQKYKDDEDSRKQTEAQAQRAQLETHWRGHYQKVIIDTLETAGLPKTEHTVARMAFYMSKAAANKMDMQTVMPMIVDRVRQEYQGALQSFSQNAAPEALAQFLGPDLVKKLQRYALEEHKKKSAAPPSPKTETSPVKKEKGDRSDWGSVSKYWTRNG